MLKNLYGNLQKDNNEKLELVGLKRNSPMMLEFIAGGIIVSCLGQLAVSKWEEHKLKLVKKKKEEEGKEESVNSEIIRLNNLISNVKDDDLEQQDSCSENIVNINDLRARKLFRSMNRKINMIQKKHSKKHNFLNSNMEIIKNPEDDEN